jgi:hypothetical protein
MEEGFDGKTAERLAAERSLDEVRNQIAWLPERGVSRNRLGMLRRAIEENWPRPEKLQTSEVSAEQSGAKFAASFYAGYAGNRGEPVAVPSAREVEFGGRFLLRLEELHAGASLPDEWGRRFGQFVREAQPRESAMSFALALRVYGDRFYLALGRELQTNAKIKRQAIRETHLVTHEAKWLAFLRETECEFKSRRPDDYARFQAHRQAKREELLHGRWQLNAKERLARMEMESERLKAFQEFFGLPDFWSWDAQQNITPIQP